MNKNSFAYTGSSSDYKYPFPVELHEFEKFISEFIQRHWMSNRTAVNIDNNSLVDELVELLSGEIIEANAGEECLTWKIPLNWCVRTAQLKKINGDVLVNFNENPLILWTHSVAFNGIISKDELLLRHISTDPARPNEIPYHYRNGYKHNAKEWGFSLPYSTVTGLEDDAYIVEIDADLDEYNTLKVVEGTIRGQVTDTILIMAHTCHPAQVADGIGCIAVAISLYKLLVKKGHSKYTYKFIFGPEYFAGAAYLSKKNKEDIKNIRFGIYLDCITTNECLGFQGSMQGNAIIDKITKNVLNSHNSVIIEKPYRELWGNDETFYNGPGFEIPIIGLGRAMYREYHYSSDNLHNLNIYSAIHALWNLNRIIEVFETDFVPVREFEGALYLSRYDLYIDPVKDKEGARSIEKINTLMDGVRSCFDIAECLNIDYFFVLNYCLQLRSKNLIMVKNRKLNTEDFGSFKKAN